MYLGQVQKLVKMCRKMLSQASVYSRHRHKLMRFMSDSFLIF